MKPLFNILLILREYIRENFPDQLALIFWFVGFFTLASIAGAYLGR